MTASQRIDGINRQVVGPGEAGSGHDDQFGRTVAVEIADEKAVLVKRGGTVVRLKAVLYDRILGDFIRTEGIIPIEYDSIGRHGIGG